MYSSAYVGFKVEGSGSIKLAETVIRRKIHGNLVSAADMHVTVTFLGHNVSDKSLVPLTPWLKLKREELLALDTTIVLKHIQFWRTAVVAMPGSLVETNYLRKTHNAEARGLAESLFRQDTDQYNLHVTVARPKKRYEGKEQRKNISPVTLKLIDFGIYVRSPEGPNKFKLWDETPIDLEF